MSFVTGGILKVVKPETQRWMVRSNKEIGKKKWRLTEYCGESGFAKKETAVPVQVMRL